LPASTSLSNSTIRSNLFAIAYGADSTADLLQVMKRAGQIQQGSTQCGDFCIAWLVAFAYGDNLATLSRTAFDQQRHALTHSTKSYREPIRALSNNYGVGVDTIDIGSVFG